MLSHSSGGAMKAATERFLGPILTPAIRPAGRVVEWATGAVPDERPELPPLTRRWLIAAGLAYLAALALQASTGQVVTLALATVTVVAAATAWNAAGRAPWVGFVVAAWAPIHLIVIVSGGTGSPIVPVAALWLVALGLVTGPRLLAPAAVAVWALMILADALAGTLTGSGAAVAAVTVAVGAAAGILLSVQRTGVHAAMRRLGRIEAEAAADAAAPHGRAAFRIRELEDVLDRTRLRFGADRAILWRVQPESNRARPAAVSGVGGAPAPVMLAGSHLAWAWEEELPLRIDGSPAWSSTAGAACIAPLGTGRSRAGVLTLEWASADSVPPHEVVAESAELLYALLGAHRREARAVAARARADRLLELAGRLSGRLDVLEFALELAETSRALVRGTGAAVAAWDGESGRVLAVTGEDGGPVAGAEFTLGGSELALAARGAATLRRRFRRTESRSLPVAAAGERWYSEPIALCVIPLAPPGGPVIGLLAVWSAQESTLDADGLTALEGIAPLAAVQLRQASAYGALVASGTRADR